MSAEGSKAPEAGAPDIEVSPEMIRAGLDAYYGVDLRFESEEARVLKIFRAMAAARDRRPSSKS